MITSLDKIDLGTFLDELAAGTSTPGGGSASALAGAMAAGLISMIARVSLGNEKYAAGWEVMRGLLDQAEPLRAELLRLAEEDIAAYARFSAALKLPRTTEEERTLRNAAIQSELKQATEIPLRIAQRARAVMTLAGPAAAFGAPMLAGDAGAALHLADAARLGALFSVKGNLPSIKDPDYTSEVERRMAEINEGIEDLRRKAHLMAETRLA